MDAAAQWPQGGDPKIRSHFNERLDSALHFRELLAGGLCVLTGGMRVLTNGLCALTGGVRALERGHVLLDVAQHSDRSTSDRVPPGVFPTPWLASG